jgi:hypothetical protein
MLGLFNIDERERIGTHHPVTTVRFVSVADGATDADCKRFPAICR